MVACEYSTIRMLAEVLQREMIWRGCTDQE